MLPLCGLILRNFGALNSKIMPQIAQIIVASTNRVKVEAALGGFRAIFPDQNFEAQGVTVESGVSAQPQSSAETLIGAHNRAKAARACIPDADYWVGIEGGIEHIGGEMEVFAWIVIMGRQKTSQSRTATFYLPHEITDLIRQGYELGDADDRVFGRSNSKQQNGSVGILTDDVITRRAYYEHAVILALIPFKNTTLTFGEIRLNSD
jgi:inosine/xanthosine triphosphatase